MLYSFLWLAICQRSTVNVAAIRSMIANCHIHMFVYINCIYVYTIASEFCLRNLPQTFCELFSFLFLFHFSLVIVDAVVLVVVLLLVVVVVVTLSVVVVVVTVQLVVAS